MAFNRTQFPPAKIGLFALILILALSFFHLPARADNAESLQAKVDNVKMIREWGVEPVVLRLTAADHFIDFRYRVIDPEKAKALLERPIKAFLIDEKSGEKMPVPITKLGPLRSSAVNPKPNKHYVILFENLNKKIEKGNLVTVVIGDFRAEHMSVE